MAQTVLARLRQPEYTGENRCIPCTAANVVITIGLSIGISYGWVIVGGPLAWLVGGIVFFAGLAAIWLRGYLVPGTPVLTKQYFPDWLLRKFDKGPALAGAPGDLNVIRDADATGTRNDRSDNESTTNATDDELKEREEIDPEALLSSAGVVGPCEHEDDLCLRDGFRTSWREQIETIDEDIGRTELARELDMDPEEIEFEDHGTAFLALDNDEILGQWESRPAMVADLAAARELPDWVDGWDDLHVGARSQVISGLRIFIDTCPNCEGPVTVGRESVESCCLSRDVIAATCTSCDVRLLEMQTPEPA